MFRVNGRGCRFVVAAVIVVVDAGGTGKQHALHFVQVDAVESSE